MPWASDILVTPLYRWWFYGGRQVINVDLQYFVMNLLFIHCFSALFIKYTKTFFIICFVTKVIQYLFLY